MLGADPGPSPFCAAVDWVTSSFRLWLLAEDGAVLGERRSEDGMVRAAAGDGFAALLERHLGELGAGAELPVIVCGMAGARQGWREAGYLDTPCDVDEIMRGALTVDGHPRDVRILPGIAQREAAAPDVLRGEETQLLGLAADGMRSGVVCMPGTHSKWVTLENGKVTGFSSFLTGELFAVLAQHSILSVAVDGSPALAPGDAAFLDAAKSVQDDPQSFSNLLFQIRAGQLLGFSPATEGAARLSGLCIGLELAGASARLGETGDVALIASGSLGALYRAALEARGLRVRVFDAKLAVRRGLWSTARTLWGIKA